MVDMSHGNSSKQHKKQIDVCKNIADPKLSLVKQGLPEL